MDNKKILKNIIKRNKQLGDVDNTFSSNKELYRLINFKPKTSLSTGINKFVNWYKKYNRIK